MRLRPFANSLIMSIVLGCGALGCGKYGPPVRVYDLPAPVAAESSDADEADDESEPRPDQP